MLFQLKVHGYGYQYLFFDELHYFYVALKELTVQEISEIIFDSEALGKLRLYNKSARLLIDNPYLAEPSDIGFFYGMDFITRLEAKPKIGKRVKYKFYDLRNEELLFGFSNVETNVYAKKGLLVLEKCLGDFGKSKLMVPELRFEDLKFNLIYIETMKESVIESIYHLGKQLEFENDELICLSKRAYYI